MIPKDSFLPGIMVRHKRSGKLGVVVFDCFRCCGGNEVAIEWDGETGIKGSDVEILEIVGLIEPKINFTTCGHCIFCNGSKCLRYVPGRLGMLFSSDSNNKTIPNRIYPYCQLRSKVDS